ncbi:hypothetical protein GCM10017771_10010 [Streptomyces capitiformicae]|uniref:Uncharacterized protein n=1 Tax=Streptomyces capitiformicae TaxID=2014920 RepID=A0A919GG49_9ACTN|nr:hypothetical protein GCM10017771_10010 [Streptomyces capitiformicae]
MPGAFRDFLTLLGGVGAKAGTWAGVDRLPGGRCWAGVGFAHRRIPGAAAPTLPHSRLRSNGRYPHRPSGTIARSYGTLTPECRILAVVRRHPHSDGRPELP